jgi:hypothetical protein
MEFSRRSIVQQVFLKIIKPFRKSQINKTYLFSCFLILILSFSVYVLPSYSDESITIPDISNLKPFSSGTQFMSLEGFVIYYCRVNYGREISRTQARKLIKSAKTKRITIVKKSVSPNVLLTDRQKKLVTLKRKLSNYKKQRSNITINNNKNYLNAKKVILLPFINNPNKSPEAVDYVAYFTQKYFKNKGYEVVDARNLNLNLENINFKQAHSLAKSINADLIISGEINRYERYKKFSATGFALDFLISSVHNYADVSLKTKIFKVSQNSYVFENESRSYKKHQIMGLFHGTKGVASYAVNSAVKKLFNNY